MTLLGRPRVRDVVTLVIESTDVRYLTTKGGHVDKWGSSPVPQGLVSEGLITDIAEVSRVIDGLFDAWGLRRKRVITSLSGFRSTARVLDLPRLKGSALEKAIHREAEDQMPVSLENFYLSWQALSAIGEQQRVYLLGVPRDLLDAQSRALAGAGIPPFVMDLKPLALVRAVNQDGGIIVNVERGMMDIALVADHWSPITRTLSFRGEQTDAQVWIDLLLNTLPQMLSYYEASQFGPPLQPTTPIYLTGRLASTGEGLDKLKQAIERPVKWPQASIPCPEGMPIPEFMTNLGLALKKV